MNRFYVLTIVLVLTLLTSCGKKVYQTNGETIYKTGRNLQGEKMINRRASSIPLVKSCVTCHGRNGDAMKAVSIRFSDLSSRNKLTVPYTDTLFYRFLDLDLKSDGTKANIGVIWKMNDKDKQDLLDYLKSL